MMIKFEVAEHVALVDDGIESAQNKQAHVVDGNFLQHAHCTHALRVSRARAELPAQVEAGQQLCAPIRCAGSRRRTCSFADTSTWKYGKKACTSGLRVSMRAPLKASTTPQSSSLKVRSSAQS